MTYARRYALFALVGIAGEDDLDAPDLMAEPSPAIEVPTEPNPTPQNTRKSPNGWTHKPRQPKAVLAAEPSATLRDELITEIADLTDNDELALWAHRRLPAKNTLTADDALAVEAAYRMRLEASVVDDVADPASQKPSDHIGAPSSAVSEAMEASTKLPPADDKQPQQAQVTPLCKPVRQRDKVHLLYVAAQPCLVCRRSPCDAHHLKFAQPRTLGRKVSDEFTVPLCRDHHQQLHRYGNEMAWWANAQLAPLEAARDLWAASSQQPANSRTGTSTPDPEALLSRGGRVSPP